MVVLFSDRPTRPRSEFGLTSEFVVWYLPLYPCLYNPPYWIVVHILVRRGQWIVGLTGHIYYTHIGKVRGGYMPCTPVCRQSRGRGTVYSQQRRGGVQVRRPGQ